LQKESPELNSQCDRYMIHL